LEAAQDRTEITIPCIQGTTNLNKKGKKKITGEEKVVENTQARKELICDQCEV
jgi:hypothetical protein